jgi:hypothetical protein
MSHNINIHNKSGHDQEFEVHGWNNNQNITVGPGATVSIQADDGTSGAIIALHDGHEGEQAEITKCGFGGQPLFRYPPVIQNTDKFQETTLLTSVTSSVLVAI